MPGFMKGVGNAVSKFAKSTYNKGSLKQGVDAFRSWKKKPKMEEGGAGKGASLTKFNMADTKLKSPGKVGEFNTGFSSLKPKKESAFQKAPLY